MADFSSYQIQLGKYDYPIKYNSLVTALTPYLTEIETARGLQASLLDNMNYLLSQKVNSSGLSADLSTNNFRIRNLPTPVAADEPATKAYADGLSFTSALPAQAGSAGKEITTDGTTAAWGASAYGSLAILNYLGYFRG